MHNSRRGFTLIELLVVIAIIAVLIALLLPAVQAAREAARRSQCVNNLKQMALAIMNYESSNGSLPPVGSTTPTGANAAFQNQSLKTRILPFMEQQPLYNSINYVFGMATGTAVYGSKEDPNCANGTLLVVQVNTFLCPSDPNVPNAAYNMHSYGENMGNCPNYTPQGSLDGPAWYLGVSGLTLCSSGTTVTQTMVNPVGLSSVIDGLSNTAMFSEIVRGQGTLLGNGYPIIFIGGTTNPCTYNTDQALGADCQSKALTQKDGSKGMQWARYYVGRGGGYTHTMLPNQKSCIYKGVGTPLPVNLIGATSYHLGGVNAAFLDGSVKFIKSSINYNTWHALGSRNGGEIISSDAY